MVLVGGVDGARGVEDGRGEKAGLGAVPDRVVEVLEAVARPATVAPTMDLGEDSLLNAEQSLAEALDELVGVLRNPDAIRSIPDVDRTNLAKYLTIAKLRLENAIAIVRTADPEA